MNTRNAKTFLDILGKSISIISVLVGALWALSEYFSFKKEYDQLQIVNQQLSIKQSELAITMAKVNIDAASLNKTLQEYAQKTAEVNFKKSVGERIEITSDIDVIRIKQFSDESSLYAVTLSYSAKKYLG